MFLYHQPAAANTFIYHCLDYVQRQYIFSMNEVLHLLTAAHQDVVWVDGGCTKDTTVMPDMGLHPDSSG